MNQRRNLILYTKHDCHLCDEMKAQIDRLRGHMAIKLQIVDITGDIELERRHGEEVPVLVIDGKKSATARIESSELIRILEQE